MESDASTVLAQPIVGLVPAAGHGRRLGHLPYSKEIYPIRLASDTGGREAQPKAVGRYLLEKMRHAGIRKALIVIREGKWDILEQFKDGAAVDMRLGYLLATVPWGVPYTLDQAYPFVRDNIVALGFPDIVFHGNDAFQQIVARQATSRADVVLGLFPANRPSTMDVVEVTDAGRVNMILSKPAQTTLDRTWGIAVWTASFTSFLHSYLARRPTPDENQSELFIGEVINAGITEGGLTVEGITVSNDPFVDIGVPGNLERISKG